MTDTLPAQTGLNSKPEADYKPVMSGSLTWSELVLGTVVVAIHHTPGELGWVPTYYDRDDSEPRGVFHDPAALMIGKLVGLLPPDGKWSYARVVMETDTGTVTLPYSAELAVWTDDQSSDDTTTSLLNAAEGDGIGREAYLFKVATENDVTNRRRWLGQIANQKNAK